MKNGPKSDFFEFSDKKAIVYYGFSHLCKAEIGCVSHIDVLMESC